MGVLADMVLSGLCSRVCVGRCKSERDDLDETGARSNEVPRDAPSGDQAHDTWWRSPRSAHRPIFPLSQDPPSRPLPTSWLPPVLHCLIDSPPRTSASMPRPEITRGIRRGFMPEWLRLVRSTRPSSIMPTPGHPQTSYLTRPFHLLREGELLTSTSLTRQPSPAVRSPHPCQSSRARRCLITPKKKVTADRSEPVSLRPPPHFHV